jgi:mono/diheme cytochrome c family protein
MTLNQPKWTRLVILSALILLCLGFVAYGVWYKLFRRVHTVYASDQDYWKHGSIGVEDPEGIPYWIWLELPKIFPDKLRLPGGYTGLGILWEEGSEMPIGFTKEIIGFPRVGINCAACHTGTVRATPEVKPTFLYAGPSTRFDSQAYVRFLFACAHDDRFNADTILTQLNYDYHLSFVDRLLYRYLIIPQTKKALLEQEKTYAFMKTRPDWGPGRTDMDPFKMRVMKLPDDGTIGSTDIMAIWDQQARPHFLRHSDGMNTTLVEPVRAAALASGANKDSIDIKGLDRIQNFLMNLRPPKYPFATNPQLTAQGKQIFDRQCASCHAFGEEKTGQVIPYKEVGTDPHRADHWTQTAADKFNEFAADKVWKFNNFRHSDGYVSLALDGIWARAPYLHNGSVPSMEDLLKPKSERPPVFYRGYDVYDQKKMGFISSGSEAERVGFRYDTNEIGNSNVGHLYGTDLAPDQRQALIEYLKTL